MLFNLITKLVCNVYLQDHIFDSQDFTSPNAVNHAEGKNPVSVGRVRLDLWDKNRVNFWVVADNLRKGAALNSLQILDELL